jgi:hypothetical protein
MLTASLMCVVTTKVNRSGGSLGYDSGIAFAAGDAEKWYKEPKRPKQGSMFVSPSAEALEKFFTAPLEPRTGKKSGVGTPANADPALSVDESRLIALLVGDEAIHAALLQSGLNLQRRDLDRRVGRDDFWTDLVEVRFNDPAVVAALPDVDIPPALHDVAPNCSVAFHRSVEVLRRRMLEVRASFTLWHSNWNQSGQNDATNFDQFVAQPGDGSMVMPNISKCALLVFYATGRGDENHNGFDVLQWISKIGRGDSIYDDGDENPIARRQKKPRDDSGLQFTEALMPVMKEVSGSFAAMAGNGRGKGDDDGGRRNADDRLGTAVDRSDNMRRMITNARQLAAEIRKAKEEGEEEDLVDMMVEERDVLVAQMRALTQVEPRISLDSGDARPRR